VVKLVVGSIVKAPVPLKPLVLGNTLLVKVKLLGVTVDDKLVAPA
jgi:hypothetical protein